MKTMSKSDEKFFATYGLTPADIRRIERAKKKAEKALDSQIEQAWYRLASGIEVSVLDIPRIFRDAKIEMAAGKTAEEAVTIQIARYRKN